jgi:hypothetical protein
MTNATVLDLAGVGNILMHYDASGPAALFTDTAGTTAVSSDGQSVKCWKPEADAALQVNLTEATNPPTYTASDNVSGYKAVTFDGSNDVLGQASTGLTTAQRIHIVAAYRFLGSPNTLWCRGSSAWQRGYCSTTSDSVQDSVTGLVSVAGIPTGRRCAAWVNRSSQTQINCLGFCNGDRSDHTPATLNAALYLGALTGGSQFGNFALNEFYAFADAVEWGQVLRICTIVRNKWGITDTNAMPQAAGGALNPFTSVFGK